MFPHGGNQMSLAIAAGFGLGGAESYPGVFGDFGGFADDARIENGFITLSDRPGIGFEGQARALQDHAGAGGDLSAVMAHSVSTARFARFGIIGYGAAANSPPRVSEI